MGWLGKESKYHFVDWDIVCSPIREGDLRMKTFAIFNEGLLGKWPWRFNCERNRWWRKVVSARHGEVRGRGTHWKFACRMRWGFGRVSKEAGKSF